METHTRNGRLAALDVFIGEWIEQVEVPDAPLVDRSSSGI
jgi:hypothetical protein